MFKRKGVGSPDETRWFSSSQCQCMGLLCQEPERAGWMRRKDRSGDFSGPILCRESQHISTILEFLGGLFGGFLGNPWPGQGMHGDVERATRATRASSWLLEAFFYWFAQAKYTIFCGFPNLLTTTSHWSPGTDSDGWNRFFGMNMLKFSLMGIWSPVWRLKGCWAACYLLVLASTSFFNIFVSAGGLECRQPQLVNQLWVTCIWISSTTGRITSRPSGHVMVGSWLSGLQPNEKHTRGSCFLLLHWNSVFGSISEPWQTGVQKRRRLWRKAPDGGISPSFIFVWGPFLTLTCPSPTWVRFGPFFV